MKHPGYLDNRRAPDSQPSLVVLPGPQTATTRSDFITRPRMPPTGARTPGAPGMSALGLVSSTGDDPHSPRWRPPRLGRPNHVCGVRSPTDAATIDGGTGVAALLAIAGTILIVFGRNAVKRRLHRSDQNPHD